MVEKTSFTYLYYISLRSGRVSGARASRATYGVPLGPGWLQDHTRMDGPRKFRIRNRKIRENRKICFPPVLLYYGQTRAPTDMVGVPTDWAWPEDHAGAIRNPEFRILTELEPENRFSRFAPFWLNQGTYRHLQQASKFGVFEKKTQGKKNSSSRKKTQTLANL